MAAGTLNQSGLRIANLTAAKRALRRISPDAHKGLKAASHTIAQQVVSKATARASARAQSAKAAQSLRARAGDSPTIALGGARYPFALGAEFGGGRTARTRQFPAWRGSSRGAGYFLWPTVRDLSGYINDAYMDALDDALAKAERAA